MKAGDLLDLATRNLRESVLRNFLTTLGIAVGVASLVAMLSLGVGLQRLASRRLVRSGLFDTIVVYPRREAAAFQGGRQRVDPNPAPSRPVDEQARQEIARQPDVAEVYPDIRFAAEVVYEGRSHFVNAASLPPSARDTDLQEDLEGHFFTSPSAEEVILHKELARDLTESPGKPAVTGKPAVAGKLVGQEIILHYAERRSLGAGASSGGSAAGGIPWGLSMVRQEKKLRVVGITDVEPGGGLRGMGRARLFVPLELAEKLNPMQFVNLTDAMRSSAPASTYQTLIVRASAPARVRDVQEKLKSMGFGTFSLLDASKGLQRFFIILDLFLGIFGSLALAVASLGIINTLVMAILERRREIGIMKALGASDADIKSLFFAEAGSMGLLGGAFGVALGWTIGRAINFGANIYLERRDLPPETIWFVPWWLVAGAIGFSLVVSLVSGLYPASRAAKLDPVQTLRYE